MGKKFVKILVVILILGGIAGGAYYFTDGFGTKNTSIIIGNWKRSEEKYEGNGVVWKFFENGTLFLGKYYLSRILTIENMWDKVG